MNEDRRIFTIGDLKSWIKDIPNDTELIFQGNLTFYRIKRRGENLVQMEFNQIVTAEEI